MSSNSLPASPVLATAADASRYQVKSATIKIIAKLPSSMSPARPCPGLVDYVLNVEVNGREKIVDLRTDRFEFGDTEDVIVAPVLLYDVLITNAPNVTYVCVEDIWTNSGWLRDNDAHAEFATDQ